MFPLDLHVLGLPLAFNLSHDQTLQSKFFASKPKLQSEISRPNSDLLNRLRCCRETAYSNYGCLY